MDRRRLFTAGLAAAASLPVIAACSRSDDSAESVQFSSPNVTDMPSARNVKDFGAVGDGEADDTAAVAAAFDVTGPVAVYFPGGTYRVTAWPEMENYAAISGDGADVTTVFYEGDDTLLELRDKQRINFRRMGFYFTGENVTGIRLSGCFRCSFDAVTIRGNHTSSNFPQFVNQNGVVLDENTGGTMFINSDINNFGVGLTTACIQNYLTSSKLTSNRIGVLGTGGDFNAGLSITNSEFVSDNDPRTTDRHLVVDGPSNDFWLTNVWFEGAEVAMSIGAAGQGGPSQFGLLNCKVSARTTCIELIYCRQPYLSNIIFDADPGFTPAEMTIDPEFVATGTAINLISTINDDVDGSVFPDDWNVIGRGTASGPTFTSTVVTRASAGGGDLLQAQAPDGAVTAAVLSSGAFLSDRAEAGVVLKDENDGYWRLTVGTDGSLGTAPLGNTRPS